jgi:hypothetical protein
LPEAWKSLVDSKPWDIYMTFTFVDYIHPVSARRLFDRFIRKLNARYYGTHFRRKHVGFSYVVATEMQKRGVVHFHALLRGDRTFIQRGASSYSRQFQTDIARAQLISSCSSIWATQVSPNICGFSDVAWYDPKRAASGYISKYVSKGGELDLRFINN